MVEMLQWEMEGRERRWRGPREDSFKGRGKGRGRRLNDSGDEDDRVTVTVAGMLRPERDGRGGGRCGGVAPKVEDGV